MFFKFFSFFSAGGETIQQAAWNSIGFPCGLLFAIFSENAEVFYTAKV